MTTLIAEAVALGFVYTSAKKILPIQIKKREIISVVLGCFAIMAVCRGGVLVAQGKTILTLAVAIPVSVIVYVAILFFCKNQYVILASDLIKKKLSKESQ